MASDESDSMRQDKAADDMSSLVQSNAGSNVHQAGHDINQINQTTEGQQNQTIGQIFGGVVVYVSGGQAIINNAPSQDMAAQAGTERPRELAPCPYRGLLAYHEKDSEFYFGRTKEIAQLWSDFRALHGDADKKRLLPIYGPSGSGKSSLVRAGVIPKLAQEPLPGKEQARVAVMVPGTQPLQALAGMLARIATQDAMAVGKTKEFAEELSLANRLGTFDGLHRIASLLPEVQTVPLVVVVDQFEEVYSLCKDGTVRDAFIGNLLYAAAEVTQAVSVILTFRSDFLAETFQHPLLNRLFSEQGFLAPMMDEGALREAIAQPAANAGRPLDEGTISLLIEQTEGREGALPLLQFALTRIWDGMGKGVEPAQTLRNIGGVGGALADSAQRIYGGLSQSEQDIARRFFLGLVQLGEGGQDTRRRVPVSSLMAAREQLEQVRRVMGKFVSSQARLITLSSEGGVELAEVSHEALIRHWGLLRGWVEQNRDLLRQQRKIEASAVAWQEQGKVSGYLLQGVPLIEAIQFENQQKDSFPLSHLAKGLVQKSVNHRRWTRLKTASWSILPMLLLVVVLESRIRENVVNDNRAKLDQQEGTSREREAVNALIEGCHEKNQYKLPGYVIERLFGNCRSLSQASLGKAKLSSADLRSADFRDADFRDADLRFADLRFAELTGANLISAELMSAELASAELRYADFSDANLISADLSTDLSYANLKNADLRDTIALSTDFRETKNLIQEQFEGTEPPLLCNSPLPKSINIDKDRDCNQIAAALQERYPGEFENFEAAQEYVDEERQKTWDN